MEADRALDAEVVQYVMGWVDVCERTLNSGETFLIGTRPEGERAVVPCYSFELGQAWKIVEALQRRGYWCRLQTPFDDRDTCYWAGFTPHGTSGWNGRPDHWTNAQTLPRAICLAALRVAGSTS